jgi:hypothetical protein
MDARLTYIVNPTSGGAQTTVVVPDFPDIAPITVDFAAEDWRDDVIGDIRAELQRRITGNLEIGEPTPAFRGERVVALDVRDMLKVALYRLCRRERVTQVELARAIDSTPQRVGNFFDLYHATKVEVLDEALRKRFGLRAEIRLWPLNADGYERT